MHRGDYTSIGAAIQAAQNGDKIVIRQGIYEEALVIDKVLEIIGEGKFSDVVIQASEEDAILFT